ncbi:MAG: chalcone isomerase family protein [Polyangiales bacterium]
MRSFVRTCALAVTLSMASPALANECGSVRMPNQITVANTPLVLNGMGIREATVFNIDVYVAGLYVEHRSGDGNAIAAANEHRRLVLHFVRDVSRDDLTGAFTEGFRRNAGGSLGALQARINRLIGWMPAATNGMELTFTYIPGAGLRVHVGSSARGIIEGEDFARVFFSIWLGSHPPNAGLRRGLLGGSCD